jgi:hypothetical protein
LVLSEEAQLSILKDRLQKIRSGRRNSIISAVALSFVLAFVVQHYWSIMVIGGILWAFIVVLFVLTVIRYYNIQEAKVLWQIQKITKGNRK